MTSEPRAWNQRADELAAEHRSTNEPIGWFDKLYAEGVAGDVTMPWDHTDPNAALREWAERSGLRGEGRRAVVVGCGLGADAAYVASLGFETTGFDLSPHAIRVARERFRETGVDFLAADLLDLPPEWVGAFDLVVEIYTIQAVPEPPRTDIASGVRALVAPGGSLLAIQFRASGEDDSTEGPPFALGEGRIRSLGSDTLDLVELEAIDGPLWRVEYRRPAAP
jgi:2-polyprenyl-3-methyl-5-hydroxy-6-metoxy-1,4-benzoquinol methylase